MNIDIQKVEKAIGIPALEWKGRCFEIASAMVQRKVVEGTAVYGHWVGSIAQSSFFSDKRALGFCNHGWVVLHDELTVVDPTRWVFEDKRPYIFIGTEAKTERCDDFESDEDGCCIHCGHTDFEHEEGFFRPCKFCKWPYDEGGNQLRELMKDSPPAKGIEIPRYDVFKHLTKEQGAHVRRLFGGRVLEPGARLTQRQAMWLANLPYDDFEEHAHAIYTALRRAKAIGLAPIDNEKRAKRLHDCATSATSSSAQRR